MQDKHHKHIGLVSLLYHTNYYLGASSLPSFCTICCFAESIYGAVILCAFGRLLFSAGGDDFYFSSYSTGKFLKVFINNNHITGSIV